MSIRDKSILDYKNADFESMKANVIQNISKLTDEWTDYNETDEGIVLINLFCGIADMLLYYQDKRAEEVYLPTARLRKSVIDLATMFDYRLSRVVSAEVMVTFTLKEPQDSIVSIPKYTEVMTSGGISYTLVEYGEIPVGEIEVTLKAIQGTLHQEIFTSSGEKYQKYGLESTSIAENFFEVYVNDELWIEDKNVPSPLGTNLLYMVRVDEMNNATLEFSHLIGKYPDRGDTVKVVYIDTDGEEGTIKSGAITEIGTYFEGVHLLDVINREDSSVGRGRETVGEAKINAPKSLRSMWRAVNSDDYEVLALKYPGIGKAKAKKGTDYPWKTVDVFVAPPEEIGKVTDTTKKGLKEYLELRNGVCTDVVIKDGIFVPVIVNVEVKVKYNYNEDDVKMELTDTIEEFLSYQNRGFGGKLLETNTLGLNVEDYSSGIILGDLYALLDGVPGVQYINIIKLARDGETGVQNLTFDLTEIPYLKEVSVTVLGGDV